MRTMYPMVIVLLVLISGANWWFLRKWIPKFHSRQRFMVYWFITIAAWGAIGYSWILHPGTPFFYQWITPLVYLSFIWLIGNLILLLIFPILFAMRKLINKKMMPTRRTFLKKVLYAAPALAFAVSVQGVYSSKFDMVTRRMTLSYKRLPQSLKGFKIAQISDAHLGTFFTLDQLDHALALVKAEKPDILVITGDFIDDLTLLGPGIKKISELSALVPHGIYFCWGNHEYFRDIERIRQGLLKSPIHILENSNVPIVVGDATLYVIGVDYPWANKVSEKTEKQQQFLKVAQQGIPDQAFRVLLAHHPDFIFDAFAMDVPLTLAGHTHGGQINILGRSLLPLKYNYMRGLYQDNHNYAYVNVGVGQWFPMRLGCPPEISVITLA